MIKTKLTAVDLFCGGGGTSTGLMQACMALGIDPRAIDLTAVNHWEVAVATHAANHPAARHIQSRIEQLQPENIVPGGRADLLWASPECIHHSVARGGRPRDDQSRAQAWTVLDWVQRLQPTTVCIENVPEFVSWGPLYVSGSGLGKPIRAMQGQTFEAWVAALRSMNYRVEHRVLNCADYGDATTRRRFFMIARRGNKRPIWPFPSHAEAPGTDLFGANRAAWRPARDVIDWSNPGHSIFLTKEQVRAAGLKVKRPLADNTISRIQAGIEKYWGEWAEPFLVAMRGTSDGQLSSSATSLNGPLPTITASGTHLGIVQPFMVEYYGSGTFARVDTPLPTVTTKSRHGLVCPFVMSFRDAGGLGNISSRLSTLDAPVSTIAAGGNHLGLIEPLILNQDARGIVRAASDPLPTIAGAGAHAIVRPMVMEFGGQKYLLDILFRMLTPAELAAAHSFPIDYQWSGTRAEVIKQIGNSVPVGMSGSICRSVIGHTRNAA